MAHELEMINGKGQMFSVRELPWHKLGIVVNEAPTVEEAIKLAGLDWEVGLHKQWYFDGKMLVENLTQCQTQTVYRKTDGKVLGEVGPKWHPLQNIEAFKWFDPFLASGQASLETAGCLNEGRRVWVMAKINRDDCRIVGDDKIRKYIMLSNSHDGTQAIRVGYTPQRVVCSNTLAMAHGSKASALLKVKHTKSLNETMDKIRDIMNVADAAFEATAEQYRFLTTKGIVASDLKKYVDLVFKKDSEESEEDDQEETEKRSLKEDDARLMINKIIPHFENGRGADLPGVKGTLWGALNSISSFLTWERCRTQDARLDNLWFGESVKINKKALDVAVKMAKTL